MFIYVEHAYNFPPGFWFKVRYSKKHQWRWSAHDHVFGNSASVWYSLISGEYGSEYYLLGLHGNNMLFGHRSVVQLPTFMSEPKNARAASSLKLQLVSGWQPSVACAYEEGFLNKSVWYGKDALNIQGVRWWTQDAISHEVRLRGMMDHVRFSPTMQWMASRNRHLDQFPMPARRGTPASSSGEVMLPYPVELRLDDSFVPIHGACRVDSCARERVKLV